MEQNVEEAKEDLLTFPRKFDQSIQVKIKVIPQCH